MKTPKDGNGGFRLTANNDNWRGSGTEPKSKSSSNLVSFVRVPSLQGRILVRDAELDLDRD